VGFEAKNLNLIFLSRNEFVNEYHFHCFAPLILLKIVIFAHHLKKVEDEQKVS